MFRSFPVWSPPLLIPFTSLSYSCLYLPLNYTVSQKKTVFFETRCIIKRQSAKKQQKCITNDKLSSNSKLPVGCSPFEGEKLFFYLTLFVLCHRSSSVTQALANMSSELSRITPVCRLLKLWP